MILALHTATEHRADLDDGDPGGNLPIPRFTGWRKAMKRPLALEAATESASRHPDGRPWLPEPGSCRTATPAIVVEIGREVLPVVRDVPVGGLHHRPAGTHNAAHTGRRHPETGSGW